MDAKPQRPLRSLRVHGDENVPVVVHKTLHQRHKSTGVLSAAMGNPLAGGGLKIAAKRTAFGDVSNTNVLHVVKDDSALVIGKKPSSGVDDVSKEKKVVPVLRPTQRPLSVSGIKAILNATTSTTANHAQTAIKQSLPDVQPAGVPRKSLVKRSTTIFRDTATVEREQQPPKVQEAPPVLTTAPVHQNLAPRHHKSQPFMRDEQPVLRRTKSKYSETFIDPEEVDKAAIPVFSDEVKDVRSDEIYHGGVDNACGNFSDAEETLNGNDNSGIQLDLLAEKHQVTEPLLDLSGPIVEPKQVETQTISTISEPEEYWDDDDDDEYYDEDGYTTARSGRSGRSRGDNTTDGATTVFFPKVTLKALNEIAAAKEVVENSRSNEDYEDDTWDTSMVAEYGDEIFKYMRELEMKMLPNANYMDNQAEIQWSMRSVLMDWLVQVHHRFNLLPETLFLCVNYIDRFLSCKIVSLGKLQLVGATAIFVAAKYEEINCPSVQEIVYMVDNGYSVDEILKAERFMLSMLQFELGWPGPMSFLRRVSKADDYDLETRTLAKYFLEITIMDERFVGSPPSFVAAAAHCLARFMLRKGDWSQAHVYYSEYTYTQLRPIVAKLLGCCEVPRKHHSAIFEKYCDRRFRRAALFVEGEMGRGFVLPEVPASAPFTTPVSESSLGWRRHSRK